MSTNPEFLFTKQEELKVERLKFDVAHLEAKIEALGSQKEILLCKIQKIEAAAYHREKQIEEKNSKKASKKANPAENQSEELTKKSSKFQKLELPESGSTT